MKIYNKEEKEILKLETELAMDNLARCIAFAYSLDNNKTYYEYEQLLAEYKLLKNVRKDLVCSDYYDYNVAVCDADYLLLKKWGWLDIQKYKELSSNIEE